MHSWVIWHHFFRRDRTVPGQIGLGGRTVPNCSVGRSARAGTAPGGACGASDHGPLRPSADPDHAEYHRADFDLAGANQETEVSKHKRRLSMPIYTVRLFARSSVRLTERPYAEATLPTFTMNFPPYFSVTAIDNVIDHGGVQVPKGLTLNVQVEANGLPIALEKATQAATYFLSTLSCTCNAAVAQPKPLWAYDATPDLLERELLLIIYDYNININTRRLLQASWEAVLNGLFHGVWLEGVTSDESQRMQRAVQSVRRGLADTDDVLDEFLIHWSSLETLDVVYKRVFHHQAMYTYKTCGNCDMAFLILPQVRGRPRIPRATAVYRHRRRSCNIAPF